MHKDKKITLLPLSPADIRKHFKGLAENVGNESSDAKPNGIKLKEGVYIATTSAAAELCDNHDAPCYIMLCRYKSFPTAPMSCTMHPVVTNLLQEIDDGMESRTTPIQEGEDDEDIDMLDTFMKLQVVTNSVITFVSDSADTPARFRRYLIHTTSK